MAKLFANSGEPNQTPQNAASDLDLHCLPITLLGVTILQWVNSDAALNYKYMFGPHRGSCSECVNHYSQTHIIKNTVMKQSKSDDLKPL